MTAMVVLIQDIVDRKSRTAWLKALPFDAAQNRQIAVAVAALAADNPAIPPKLPPPPWRSAPWDETRFRLIAAH